MGEPDRRRGDPNAPRFGLPASLHIPIAASSTEAIEKYVGSIRATLHGRNGVAKAVAIEQAPPTVYEADVPLWSSPLADEALARLYPATQVWVDLDFNGYRRAFLGFGLTIPRGFFLDHIQNRRAMRLRNRSHPWLRLCPVDRRVNTSGGLPTGGEGMEFEYVEQMAPSGGIEANHSVIYADPMDLTKMLNIPPGVGTLDGVRDTQQLFYPVAK
jgi:hypothetical protein